MNSAYFATRVLPLFLPITGTRRVASGSSVTRGEDQSAGQLGLRLRGVLILFEDTHTGISRLCAIAEDSTSAATLQKPVRTTRAPNRQKIIPRKASQISLQETAEAPKELPTTSGTPSRLNERRRSSAVTRPILRN